MCSPIRRPTSRISRSSGTGGASMAWLQAHLSPALRVFSNAQGPPLPQPDGYFDLIWAISVFTHITDRWSEWLLELHRVLSPSGLLIATFLAPGWYESL